MCVDLLSKQGEKLLMEIYFKGGIWAKMDVGIPTWDIRSSCAQIQETKKKKKEKKKIEVLIT